MKTGIRIFRKMNIGLLFLLLATSWITGCQPISATSIPGLESSAAPIQILVSPSATQTTSPTPTPSPTPTLTPTPTVVAYGPSNFPNQINPLTGQAVADPELLARPPVMIKVPNFPREGRPHAGLSYADMVFDYYIGEGTNRFLAVYYGKDTPKVGPIRSARLVDAQLTQLYQGILGYAGADYYQVFPVINRELGNRAVSVSSATCPALCDNGPHSVFSVFADTALLSNYMQERIGAFYKKPDLQGMYFSSQKPEMGLLANQIKISYNAYNISQWQYDPISQTYRVSLESVDTYNNLTMVPLTDRLTGEQLSFSNLIIVFARYNQLAPTLHNIELWDNKDGNRAVLFRDGESIEGIWKAPEKNLPIEFLTVDQTPLPLKPGNTWISIVGLNSTLQQTILGQWETQFRLP